MPQPREVCYPVVSMDGVSYGAILDNKPFRVRERLSQITYLYLVRNTSLRLNLGNSKTRPIVLSPSSIVLISGLIPHQIQNMTEGYTKAQRLDELIQPLNTFPKSSRQLLIGRLLNDTYAFAGAYLGVQIVTSDNAPSVHQKLWDTFLIIEDELRYPLNYSEAIVDILSKTLTIYGNRYVRKQDNIVGSPLNSIKDRRIITAVLNISNDPFRGWNLELLSKQAKMKRTTFAVCFKKLMGRTPMQVVRHARLARALRSLDNTNASIEKIALENGYGSAAAFIRAFNNEFGDTPARWRRKDR